VVLGDRERAEGGVERAAGGGDGGGHDEVVEVELPDGGHLVHKDERALKDAGHGLARRVERGEVAHAGEALGEVAVPQLVAPGQRLQRALVQAEARGPRGAALKLQIPQPALELRGMRG
jgi:hypothetical protein